MTKNIVISNLSSEKSKLIEQVKAITNEKTAAKAIFKALDDYINVLAVLNEKNKKIKRLQHNILHLISEDD